MVYLRPYNDNRIEKINEQWLKLMHYERRWMIRNPRIKLIEYSNNNEGSDEDILNVISVLQKAEEILEQISQRLSKVKQWLGKEEIDIDVSFIKDLFHLLDK